MQLTTTILSILATLFAGLSVFQFIFFQSTKKKYKAEADKAAAEADGLTGDNWMKYVAQLEKDRDADRKEMSSLKEDNARMSLQLNQQHDVLYQLILKTSDNDLRYCDKECDTRHPPRGDYHTKLSDDIIANFMKSAEKENKI